MVFDFQMNRGRASPANLLGKYSGILQGDSYAGYDSFDAPEMVRAGCMAYALRKFHDGLKIDPEDR